MDIHRPKSFHNWREFLKEYGIIVLGVLTALGGEQIVETLHWHEQVVQARQSIDDQARDSLFYAEEREIRTPCALKRLARLQEIVERPGPTPKLAVSKSPMRPWLSSAWQAAIASGAVAKMAPGIRASYSQIYGAIPGLGDFNRQIFLLEYDLKTLNTPGVLSDVARDRLESDVARLKGLYWILNLGSQQLAKQLGDMGITLTDAGAARLALERKASCTMPDEQPAT